MERDWEKNDTRIVNSWAAASTLLCLSWSQITWSAPLRFGIENLGEPTIQDVSILTGPRGEPFLQFEDRGSFPGISTRYLIQLFDKDANKRLETVETLREGKYRQITLTLHSLVNLEHDHLISFEVNRQGRSLPKNIRFSKQVHWLGQLDPKIYREPSKVGPFEIKANNDGSALLRFQDLTPDDGKVETKYDLILKKKNFFFIRTEISRFQFTGRDLIALPDGAKSVPLEKYFDRDSPQFRELLQTPWDYLADVTVTRISPRLKGASPIQFKLTQKLQPYFTPKE